MLRAVGEGHSSTPCHVVVVRGGVAGLEALMAPRDLGGKNGYTVRMSAGYSF